MLPGKLDPLFCMEGDVRVRCWFYFERPAHYIRANSNMDCDHFSLLGHVCIHRLRYHSRSFIPPLLRIRLSPCHAGKPGSLEPTDYNTPGRRYLDCWFCPDCHLGYQRDSTFGGERHWYPSSRIFRRSNRARESRYQ